MLLNGWKEISNHLTRGIRTVQRWQHLGLPITRVSNSPRSPVVARSEELDEWVTRLSKRNPEPKPLTLADHAQARRHELHKRSMALRRRRAELIERLNQLRTCRLAQRGRGEHA